MAGRVGKHRAMGIFGARSGGHAAERRGGLLLGEVDHEAFHQPLAQGLTVVVDE